MTNSSKQGDGATYAVYRDEFHAVIGADFQLPVLIETNAHEGPVYVAAEHALYFTNSAGARTEEHRHYAPAIGGR